MYVTVSRHIQAPPDKVWALVSDVTQIGRFSPETFEAEWRGGATGPEMGARFRGHVRRNEIGPVYWSNCRVSAFEEGRVFGFDVVGPGDRALSHWCYELEPHDGGTLLTESMRLHPSNVLLGVYDATLGRLRQGYNERNIATTLARIAAVLEGTEPPSQTARGSSRPMTVSDTVVVGAPPDEVWQLVADPTCISSFSPENLGADTPSTGPLAVGDRFVGHNKRGPMRWSTACEVVASNPGERFAFRVDRWGTAAVRLPVAVASWEYTFSPVDGGTLVTETWHDDRAWPDSVANPIDSLVTGGRTFADHQRRNIRRSLDNLAARFADD